MDNTTSDVEGRSYAPDARVIFYPYLNEYTVTLNAEEALRVKRVEASRDIIGVSTSKPKGGAGSFSVTLGSRVNYKALLQPGCWCTIYMSHQPLDGIFDHGVDGGLKMVGIVRSVRRIESTTDSGIKTVRYMITGEDFHSGLTNPIYINSNMTTVASSGSSSALQSLLVLEDRFRNLYTPDEIVAALVDALIGLPKYKVSAGKGSEGVKIGGAGAGRQGQPFQVPSEFSSDIMGHPAENNYFTGMLTMFLQPSLVGTIQLQSDLGNMVSAWSMVQSYCHSLLNEVYTDLLPVDTGKGIRLVPSMVLRAIPFSSNRLDPSNILLSDALGAIQSKYFAGRLANRAVFRKSLTEVPTGAGASYYVSRKIYEDEIFSFNSGRSDRERFNFFFCPTNYANDNSSSEGQILSKLLEGTSFDSISDSGSIIRNGLRPFVQYSNYAISGLGDKTEIINRIVRDIWINAHLYESGVVQFAGTGTFIPVGTNICFVDRGWYAHVEQVDNNYSVAPDGHKSFRTSVAFSRLHFISTEKQAIPTAYLDDPRARPDSRAWPTNPYEKSKDLGQLGDWDRGVGFHSQPEYNKPVFNDFEPTGDFSGVA
jgi:hypothetical protein